jgi:tryptophan synthase alpha subunit
MFRVLQIEDVIGFVSVECESHALSVALLVAIKNSEEQIQLIQQQIDELTNAYAGWLDGNHGAELNHELDDLLSEYRKQIRALAVLNTLYQEI